MIGFLDVKYIDIDAICEYLQIYRKILFCKNNPDDIRNAMIELAEKLVDIQYIKENYDAEKITSALILGGHGENGRCDE